jgi:hypothetical protein
MDDGGMKCAHTGKDEFLPAKITNEYGRVLDSISTNRGFMKVVWG